AGGDGLSCINDCARTLLPLPDSPTIPNVFPGLISNDTPSTAFTTPDEVSNRTCKSFTSSTLNSPLPVHESLCYNLFFFSSSIFSKRLTSSTRIQCFPYSIDRNSTRLKSSHV